MLLNVGAQAFDPTEPRLKKFLTHEERKAEALNHQTKPLAARLAASSFVGAPTVFSLREHGRHLPPRLAGRLIVEEWLTSDSNKQVWRNGFGRYHRCTVRASIHEFCSEGNCRTCWNRSRRGVPNSE